MLALVQATTSMAGPISQLANAQQMGQGAGATNATIAAAPTNRAFHRSPLAAVMEQSNCLHTLISPSQSSQVATRFLLVMDEKFDIELEKFQVVVEKLEGWARDLDCCTQDRFKRNLRM